MRFGSFFSSLILPLATSLALGLAPSPAQGAFTLDLLGALVRQDPVFNPSQPHSSLLGRGYGALLGPRFQWIEFLAGAFYLPVGYRESSNGGTSDNFTNYVQAHAMVRFALGRLSLGCGAYYGFALDSVAQSSVGQVSVSVPISSASLRDDRGLVGWVGWKFPLERWISLRIDGMYQSGQVNLARSGAEMRAHNIVGLAGLGLSF